MATLAEIEKALISADAAGNTEDAKSLAEELRRRKQSTLREEPDGFMPFVNKAIAEFAGAPVDLTSALLNKVGIPTGEVPFGGSESIKRGMEAIGIDIPEREPEKFQERLGQVTGEFASFGLPFLKGAQALSKAKGTAGRVGQAVFQDVVDRPIKAAAIESVAVPGVALAREISEQKGFGPGAQITAEVVGGLAPSVAAQRLLAVPMAATRLGIAGVVPFTNKGAMARAARRAQELTVDPQKSAKDIEALKGTDLSPSARTEDPGLMDLEQTVLRESPAERTRVSIRRSEATEKLANLIRKSGNVRNARRFAQQKLERLKNALDVRLEKAGDEAGEALASLGSPDRIQASIAVRNSLESALNDARVQEDQLWSAVDTTVQGRVDGTIKKYQDLSDGLSSAQKDDMPASAARVIDPRVKKTTVQELYGLYRKLGEEAVEARAAGKFNKARIAQELRTSILDDLNKFSASGEVGDSLKLARDFSAELNKKFTKGAVGRILRSSREGIEAVAPEMTLRASIGMGDIPAKLATKQIVEAADDATVLEGIGDFLKASFIREAVDPTTGRVVPGRAKTFINKYKEVLGELSPSVMDQLQAARSSEDVLRRVTSRNEAMRTAFNRPAVSSIAKLLRAPADEEIIKILNSGNPVDTMKKIVNLAKKDSTGKSIEGLRAAFADYLIDSVTSPSTLDVRGKPSINGIKLRNILFDDKINDTMRLIYSSREMADITSAAKKMAAIQKVANTKPTLDAVIKDTPGFILEKLAMIIGARVGVKTAGSTGGQIQAAQMGSQAARKWINGLFADKAKQFLADAIQDPELMKALLTYKNAKVSKSQDRVLRNYMLSSIGSRLVDAEILKEAEAERRKDKVKTAQSINISR
jgi:hypothetical protein